MADRLPALLPPPFSSCNVHCASTVGAGCQPALLPPPFSSCNFTPRKIHAANQFHRRLRVLRSAIAATGETPVFPFWNLMYHSTARISVPEDATGRPAMVSDDGLHVLKTPPGNTPDGLPNRKTTTDCAPDQFSLIASVTSCNTAQRACIAPNAARTCFCVAAGVLRSIIS